MTVKRFIPKIKIRLDFSDKTTGFLLTHYLLKLISSQ